MMSREPRRQFTSSFSDENFKGTLRSLSRPQVTIGFQLANPAEPTIFNKGILGFALTIICDIAFSSEINYSSKLVSVTEIITNGTLPSVWALKIVADEETRNFQKTMMDDLRRKGFVQIDEIEISFADKEIENLIKVAVTRVL